MPTRVGAHGRPPSSEPGVTVGDEILVSAGFAAAISAALVTVRRRRRRWYPPDSGRRDDILPVAPVVRSLHLAHLRAKHTPTPDGESTYRDDDEQDEHEDVDDPDEHTAPTDVLCSSAPLPRSSGREASNHPTSPESKQAAQAPPVGAARVAVGLREGRPVTLDLAATGGLGLAGPGAADTARALLVDLLAPTGHAQPPADPTTVVLPEQDAVTLLGPTIDEQRPDRLVVTADLDAALDRVDDEILTRMRTGQQGGLVVLLASVPDRLAARVQSILELGTAAHVLGVILGQWRAGASVLIERGGLVTATSPNAHPELNGARLISLPLRQTAPLVRLLRDAAAASAAAAVDDAGHSAEPPSPGSGGARRRPTCDSLPQRPVSAARQASDANSPQEQSPAAVSRKPDPLAPVAGTVPMLRLRLLGPPSLTRTDGQPGDRADLLAQLTPRQREVLILLALYPDGVSRAQLAATLWPDSTGSRLLNTLHNTLSRLRQRLASAAALTDQQAQRIVTVQADRCRLEPGIIAVDYWRFSAAVAARRHAGTDADRDDACHALLDHYRGELAEHHPADWLEVPRETARRDAVDAAARLARASIVTDPRRSLELLETARGFDPYNEQLYIDIMRIQRRLGRADAITRTLALLTTRLAEIDERPSPTTLELAARLQREAASA